MSVYSCNRTLLRENSMNEAAEAFGSSHIMDAIIESTRTDLDLFNSVIENDFTMAYNKLGRIFLTEEEEEKKEEKSKTGIIAKIKGLISKFIAAIKGFFGKFRNKLKGVDKSNKLLYEKYGKIVSEKGAGYKWKTKLKYPTVILKSVGSIEIEYDDTKETLNIADLADSDGSYKAFDEIIGVMNNSMISLAKISTSSVEEAKDKAKEITSKASENCKKISSRIKAFADAYTAEGEEEKEVEVTSDLVKTIVAVMRTENNMYEKRVQSAEKSTTGSIEKTMAEIDISRNVIDDEAALAILNEEYSMLSSSLTQVSAVSQAFVRQNSKEIAVFRSLFVEMGQALSKNSKESSEDNSSDNEKKEETNNESAVRYAITQLSNMYVESALSMVD